MAIGKGYFWSGLSQGVKGLYDSMQNERMVKEAQGVRQQEGALNRAQSAAQFQQLMPTKGADPFPSEFGTVEDSARAADANVKNAEAAAAAVQHGDPSVRAAAAQRLAASLAAQAEAQTALGAFRAKSAKRSGVNVPATPPPPLSKKEQMMRRIMGE